MYETKATNGNYNFKTNGFLKIKKKQRKHTYRAIKH